MIRAKRKIHRPALRREIPHLPSVLVPQQRSIQRAVHKHLLIRHRHVVLTREAHRQCFRGNRERSNALSGNGEQAEPISVTRKEELLDERLFILDRDTRTSSNRLVEREGHVVHARLHWHVLHVVQRAGVQENGVEESRIIHRRQSEVDRPRRVQSGEGQCHHAVQIRGANVDGIDPRAAGIVGAEQQIVNSDANSTIVVVLVIHDIQLIVTNRNGGVEISSTGILRIAKGTTPYQVSVHFTV